MAKTKTGGRKAGTPNKITALAKSMIQKWLDCHNTTPTGSNLTTLEKDFADLDPKDRVKITAEFIKIIMPKNINIDESEVRLTIEDKLRALAQEDDE
jgi:hypothetical protein